MRALFSLGSFVASIVLCADASALPLLASDVPGTQVAAGGESSCVLQSGGTVVCWGQNSSGQLGLGTTSAYEPFAKRSAMTSAIALGLGWSGNVCVVRSADGVVQCWGQGSGQPATIAGLTQVTLLGLGSEATWVLQGGVLRGWGHQAGNALGDGAQSGSTSTPTPVLGFSPSDPVVEVVGGFATSSGGGCARTASGGVYCWGRRLVPQSGSVGYTSIPSGTYGAGLPGPAISIGIGTNHACAVIQGGAVYCWGASPYGQTGASVAFVGRPTLVPGVSGAVQVTLGRDHSCARLSSGKVQCWGVDLSGQLGDGTITQWLPPVYVAGITQATHVAAARGGRHTCAIVAGVTWCWGANDKGQLGDGSTTPSSVPVKVQYPQVVAR